jgi:hypothetical protein
VRQLNKLQLALFEQRSIQIAHIALKLVAAARGVVAPWPPRKGDSFLNIPLVFQWNTEYMDIMV